MSASNEKKWFAYHPEEGFFRFGSAAEAKAEAEAFLEHERENARGDEWYEFIDEICWGEIRRQVREVREVRETVGYYDYELA